VSRCVTCGSGIVQSDPDRGSDTRPAPALRIGAVATAAERELRGGAPGGLGDHGGTWPGARRCVPW